MVRKIVLTIAAALLSTSVIAAERVSVYNRMPLTSGMGLVGFELVKTMNLVQDKYEFTYTVIPIQCVYTLEPYKISPDDDLNSPKYNMLHNELPIN